MPQTVESIGHAKAAGVPIIIAITKIDKPGNKIDQIKTDIAKHGLTPEDR
jgi:translation initiation factor IF-2